MLFAFAFPVQECVRLFCNSSTPLISAKTNRFCCDIALKPAGHKVGKHCDSKNPSAMAIAQSLFLLLCTSLLSCCSSRTLIKTTSHDALINYFPPTLYPAFSIAPPLPTTMFPTVSAYPYTPYVFPPGNSYFTPQLPSTPQTPAVPSSMPTTPIVLAPTTRVWCVLKPSVSPSEISKILDYACASVPTSCSETNPGGICGDLSQEQRVSYIINSHFINNPHSPDNCDFNGAATIVNVDPSSGTCAFLPASVGSPPSFPPPSVYTGSPPSLFGSPATGAIGYQPPPQGISSPAMLMTTNVPPPGFNPPPTDFDIFSSRATTAGQHPWTCCIVLVLSALLLLLTARM